MMLVMIDDNVKNQRKIPFSEDFSSAFPDDITKISLYQRKLGYCTQDEKVSGI